MTYDHELTLIQQTFSRNGIGDPISTDTETVILCGLKSVGRNEFYAAAVPGLRPERIFIIHGYEYNGEKTVKFEGARYNVLRTYATDFEEMELVCTELVGQ